jgi:hypothetical protein
MATVTPNFSWPVPTSTDLVKDGATAIEALGDSIDASLVDLKGGTTGQVLSKNSNTDMDFTWVTDAAGDITGVTAGTGISGGGTSGTVTVTNSMATVIDAKGDLVAGTANDTFNRLAVGTNGQVLTADSTAATGLKWATATAANGLTLITRETYTSASTINVNDVFSSTYDNYKIIVKNSSGNQSGLTMRLRVSGADNTSTVYSSSVGELVTGGWNQRYQVAVDGWFKGDISMQNTGTFTLDMESPNLSEITTCLGSFGTIDTGWRSGPVTMLHNSTTSFTGFSLISSGGSSTGVITVYGYQKS